jgi:hypothetical protein
LATAVDFSRPTAGWLQTHFLSDELPPRDSRHGNRMKGYSTPARSQPVRQKTALFGSKMAEIEGLMLLVD